MSAQERLTYLALAFCPGAIELIRSSEDEKQQQVAKRRSVPPRAREGRRATA